LAFLKELVLVSIAFIVSFDNLFVHLPL
jgi:hypothetical protein